MDGGRGWFGCVQDRAAGESRGGVPQVRAAEERLCYALKTHEDPTRGDGPYCRGECRLYVG